MGAHRTRNDTVVLCATVAATGRVNGTATQQPGSATHDVSDPAELRDALEAARGGDVISLADGSYGALSIKGRSYSSHVTLRAVHAGGPVFSSLTVESSSYVRFDGIRVVRPPRETVVDSALRRGSGCNV